MGIIKAGDTVEVIDAHLYDESNGFHDGDLLQVSRVVDKMAKVYFEGSVSPLYLRQVEKKGDYNETPLTHEEMTEELGLNDKVNQPSHYLGEVEVIDYIQDKLTSEQYEGYCMGNVIKYISRYQLKNGTEDLHKASVYLNWAIDERESR